MHMKRIYLFLIIVAALASCSSKPDALPADYTEVAERVVLYPDYTDVTIPANIAALNCMVEDTLATAFVAHYQAPEGEMLVGADASGVLQLDTVQWRTLLQQNRGKDIQVSVYAKRAEGWVRHPAFTLSVAAEDIDAYLSYRLIEPGYELYRQLGLYQRNLTTWDEVAIYENNRTYDDDNNHCINCHNYRQNSTRDMLFHVRAGHGGTIVVRDGQPRKIGVKDSTIITSAVYPSWHPTADLVAFSTNKTGQVFHLYHQEKVEVIDTRSDLLLYDVQTNEVTHILRTTTDMETFPCWAPDGKRLYYTCAHHVNDSIASLPDSVLNAIVTNNYMNIRYDLMAMDFDPATRTFGEPEMVVDANSRRRSISVPRVSPDGRFVLYTEAQYGQFHIWHQSADLWVKDLERDTCYALTASNSPDVEAFHSWSSNGRWFVFSSRRMDGNYTRPFIAYFDKQGQSRKAFVLPQEDPEWNRLLLKSYNVPELTRDAVRSTPESLRDCIYGTEPEAAQVHARPVMDCDGQTAASPQAPEVSLRSK